MDNQKLLLIGLQDAALILFLSVCVVTCGWSPNCKRTPPPQTVEDCQVTISPKEVGE